MRGEVAPRFFLMSGKARQKEKEEKGWGKRQVEERKKGRKKSVYIVPETRHGCDSKSRAVKKGTKEGKKGKGERERERWMDIQALNGSEKSAKSVGIYSTNASAQRRAFTTFFFLYLLPVSCTAHNHPRNRQPPWPLPEQQFCLYTLVRGTKSDTIWTSFWKGGGGRGEEKEVAEEREKEKKRMKPLFLPLKRGPWARPGEFFTESPRWKEISALAFLSIADGTHVCFHWEILLLPSLPFLFRKISTMNKSVLPLLFLPSIEDPPREILSSKNFWNGREWKQMILRWFRSPERRIHLLLGNISTKIDRNGQVWRRVCWSTIFSLDFALSHVGR